MSAANMRRKRSSPNCSILVPGQSGSFHSNLAILMNEGGAK
jgi:hypothetical protein